MLLCRISTSVVYQLPKLRRRVRLPYPACNDSQDSYEFCDFSLMNGGLFHGN